MSQPSLRASDEDASAADILRAAAAHIDSSLPPFDRLELQVVGTGEVIGRMYFRGAAEPEPIYFLSD